MNAQNAKDYLPLVQALADGRTIQRVVVNNHWVDQVELDCMGKPSWYRIKPAEPRHWWINVHKGTGTTFEIPFKSKEKADEWAAERSESPRLECVEVVEVVK